MQWRPRVYHFGIPSVAGSCNRLIADDRLEGDADLVAIEQQRPILPGFRTVAECPGAGRSRQTAPGCRRNGTAIGGISARRRGGRRHPGVILPEPPRSGRIRHIQLAAIIHFHFLTDADHDPIEQQNPITPRIRPSAECPGAIRCYQGLTRVGHECRSVGQYRQSQAGLASPQVKHSS